MEYTWNRVLPNDKMFGSNFFRIIVVSSTHALVGQLGNIDPNYRNMIGFYQERVFLTFC